MEERSSGGGGIGRIVLIGLVIFMGVYFVYPMISGSSSDAPELQPLSLKEDWGTVPEGERPEEKLCDLVGSRSTMVLSSRGGALESARMTDAKYAESVDKPDTRIELITPSKEQRMPLRTSLRVPGEAAQQVDFDNLDFELVEQTASSCHFVHKSAATTVDKVVRLTERPFELEVVVRVTNLASEPRKHRYAVEQSSWRSAKETEASIFDLGRQPDWLTTVATHTTTETERFTSGEFEPGDFDPEDGFTPEHFLRAPGDAVWAAVSSNYFTGTLFPIGSSTAAPAAEVLIEDGSFYKLPAGDPNYGHMYRARLAYPEKELATGETATYEVLAFVGPKEQRVLGAVGGDAKKYQALELIDLGMFGAIGKHFVSYVGWLYKLVGSWGWAIVLLTVTVKMLVFPLQLPMLKTTVATRRLKPEIDELTKKYKDDMMQKNLAMQELYRREKIRPALGCIPLLLQMPVWIALYQSLGTAVELYHTPFLMPLMPDLTQADPYHVIPVVLGGSSFLQQKLMPAQGMDPAQQKMMLYLMPGIFTAMMFFLPSGLGVYMLTNTWLGIIQQLLVERYIGSKLKPSSSIEVREVKKSDGDPPDTLKKVRARG